MTEQIEIRHDGEVQRLELTDNLRSTLNEEGGDFPDRSVEALQERVEELLYNLADVRPRDSQRRNEVHVSYKGEASFDYGQPAALDNAEDVTIQMIRPDRITVGWSDDDE